MHWVGFVCLSDPVRPDVKESLIKAHQAGIKLIVITDDYAKTAQYIIQQLETKLLASDIMEGTDLAAMSDEDLQKRIDKDTQVKLFARTRPEQKMRIVNALKHNDEIVAMMGDGVNDAPALKKADIGIVVGEASDVAKESADLILLDSSFSTIVAAVEE
ncbi:MAG: cation-transporting P-type ATPase [Candidatus Peribacteria bacterium]|nr:MAG: cation-transporting P-type ATPase [Candidatus Peribacteria bacterium]